MSSPLRARSLLIACLLFAAACSASGGQAEPVTESTTSTTQETTTEETTTTTIDESTTTTSPSEGDAPSLDALATLLPEASDLGPVWTEVDEDDGEDDESGDLLEDLGDECQVLDRYEADPESSVGRTYQDADGFEFELRFNRDVGDLADEAKLDRMIDDFLACEAEFDQDGVGVTFHFSGGRRTDMGRLGVEFRGHVAASYSGMDIELTLYLFAARTNNGVVVAVSTMDLISDAGEVEPVNSELFPALIAELIPEVEAL